MNPELRTQISQDLPGKVIASMEWDDVDKYWVMTFTSGEEMCMRLMAELVQEVPPPFVEVARVQDSVVYENRIPTAFMGSALQGSKADWIYDHEYDLHIPCCSQPKGTWRCGNGPLTGDAVLSGDCGELHA